MKLTNRQIIIITVILLLFLSLITRYVGFVDVKDYTDTAKFFAGLHQAKLRSSHSILYGLVFSPLVKLTGNFLFFKISSVFWLFMLILSVYYINNKDRKTLLLFLLTPVIWYMAPWISPIPLASFLFLGGWFFIKKYDEKERLKYVLYSGLLIGLAWAFWDAIIYIAIILCFSFLYNKKTSSFFLFFIAVFIGTFPKLLVDGIVFGFPFFSIFKHFFAEVASVFYGGIYGQRLLAKFPLQKLSILIMIPFFSYLIYKKKNFIKNKKTIIFLTISLILVFINSQIRYLLVFTPIIILILGKTLTKKQFKIQIIIFLIIILLVINPYLIQIKYSTNAQDISFSLLNFGNWTIGEDFEDDLILKDLNKIAKDYPDEIFIVGNGPDDFQILAHTYWDSEIKELISIQDYELFLNNDTIASKTLCSDSKSWNRRDICFSVDLRKTIADKTDYENINFAIGYKEPVNLKEFELIKKYDLLYVSKRK